MGAGQVSTLYRPGATPLHRLPAQCKLAAGVAFVFIVVATPREQLWAFGLYAVALGVLVLLARLPLRLVLRRLTIETPFVAFALFLPLLAGGPRTEVGFLDLSVDGLWAAWNILAKATIGVATSVVLTATTSLPDLVKGLDRLRVPPLLTAVLSFMVRYAEVIAGEMQRMKIARECRGHDPRWLWQTRAIAHSAGTLFIRAYERGERVYLAMLSRGYDGALPCLAEDGTPRRAWAAAAGLPAFALAVSSMAWVAQT